MWCLPWVMAHQSPRTGRNTEVSGIVLFDFAQVGMFAILLRSPLFWSYSIFGSLQGLSESLYQRFDC